MISVKYKFILITPPKTGSVSLTTALLPYIEHAGIIQQRPGCFDFTDCFASRSKHTTLNAIYERWDTNKLGPFDSYHVVGSMRNPYARLVSWWKWMKGIESFRTCLDQLILPQSLNHIDHYFSLAGEVAVDQFIHLESIQEDFDIFTKIVGLPRKIVPHSNQSGHLPHQQYYDDYTRDFVTNKFRRDIEYFSYSFD